MILTGQQSICYLALLHIIPRHNLFNTKSKTISNFKYQKYQKRDSFGVKFLKKVLG